MPDLEYSWVGEDAVEARCPACGDSVVLALAEGEVRFAVLEHLPGCTYDREEVAAGRWLTIRTLPRGG